VSWLTLRLPLLQRNPADQEQLAQKDGDIGFAGDGNEDQIVSCEEFLQLTKPPPSLKLSVTTIEEAKPTQ
jgi:hypothetical protein